MVRHIALLTVLVIPCATWAVPQTTRPKVRARFKHNRQEGSLEITSSRGVPYHAVFKLVGRTIDLSLGNMGTVGISTDEVGTRRTTHISGEARDKENRLFRQLEHVLSSRGRNQEVRAEQAYKLIEALELQPAPLEVVKYAKANISLMRSSEKVVLDVSVGDRQIKVDLHTGRATVKGPDIDVEHLLQRENLDAFRDASDQAMGPTYAEHRAADLAESLSSWVDRDLNERHQSRKTTTAFK